MNQKSTPKYHTQSADSAMIAMAERVGQRVNIYEVRFIEQLCQLGELQKEFPRLGTDARSHKVIRDDQNESLRVDITFIFRMAYDTDESKKNPPVIIQATISLNYKVDELTSFGDSDVEAFAAINGAYNAWPFWREFVYSAMSRMGLPPVTLPTFRVIETNPNNSAAT